MRLVLKLEFLFVKPLCSDLLMFYLSKTRGRNEKATASKDNLFSPFDEKMDMKGKYFIHITL